MRIIHRSEQTIQTAHHYAERAAHHGDAVFDGVSIPPEISARNWALEGTVHSTKIVTNQLDSTRYFLGPQVCITHDDNRRTTWAAHVEHAQADQAHGQLILSQFIGPNPAAAAASLSPAMRYVPQLERTIIAEGEIWRYHLTLNKFTGTIVTTWITRSAKGLQLWLDGTLVNTESSEVDFPFFGLSQVAVGHVATAPPPFGLLSYKCRNTGRLFIRRYVDGQLGPEVGLDVGEIRGGLSFGISGKQILARVDRITAGGLVPTLLRSADGGKSFDKPHAIDLGGYDQDFKLIPGYTEPIVDKGGAFHVPIILSNGRESVALNYIPEHETIVEAIRVTGGNPLGKLAVFPSTVGSKTSFGNGTSDGHGLIMILATEGRLFTSNSSAGGIYFPEAVLLNHEMPLIAGFAASECYSSGLKPNIVSMDYIYLEANSIGQVASPTLHYETWDMPLPLPQATAKSKGASVAITIQSDADVEPGKVVFNFDDPSIVITNSTITSLRTATLETNTPKLSGKKVSFDILTLFHRHYGEAMID
ncbi:hypothetical protein Haur_0279 [Herpetosiphon aurantiacus DSM 785]|uniref:Uncharacterized protein n=1 Tax=Herpetosiphon aurantiacus (strain ATCC 23779 / DSM 785 / 114-95) TaxID=316274 RepID=A9B7F8_HERA2|nr:hypothetical protein Haur_0279 [Herpetosiphon aurantiacus DSM 785]